jgi:hypothetical protein
MRIKLIATILFAIPFLPACEQQTWKETKMFHEVPKKDAHGAAGTHTAEAPAHAEKAAEHK